MIALAWSAACTQGPASTPLEVLAAASLQEVTSDLALRWDAAHPQVPMRVTLGGSAQLRTMIAHGAPVDVFLPADPQHLDALGDAVGTRTDALACNRLVLVARPEASIATLQDLTTRHLRLVWGTSAVPAGAYARQALTTADALWPGTKAAIEAQVVSEELDVRQVLAKVRLGEADAGFVYATDAATAPELLAVPMPTSPVVTLVAGAFTARGREALPSLDAPDVWTERGFVPCPDPAP